MLLRIPASTFRAFLTIALAVGLPATAAAGPAADDDAVRKAVGNQLLIAEDVSSRDITVSNRKGVIVLEGEVDTLLEKQQAVELAGSIRGVRAVVDRLTVAPKLRADPQIAERVEQAIAFDPATDKAEVDWKVKDGRVVLTGQLPSWQEKQLYGLVVSGVGGVREVDNRITVGPVSHRPDAEIEADIGSRLRFDAWLEEAFIDVAVADARVKLSGRVASPAERSRAYRDAWVAGVEAVDTSGLEVEPDLRGEQEIRLRRSRIPDGEIAEAISAAWLHDPRVRAGELGVTVDDGVALVTGVVQTIEARRAAVRDARHTRGVWRVEDRLRVASPVDRDDSRLKARIIEQLQLDPLIPAADVEVLVEDGRVVLLGSVPDARASRRAQTLVARMRGVAAVDDRLQLADGRQQQKPAGDDALRAEVLNELRFNPTLRPAAVQVQAEQGVVTLRGTVDRWTQRLEAAREAFQAGAVEVNNLLRVREAGAPAPGELDAARTDR